MPATRAYRIAFVGDSFTEGMQVAYESTFCARLEKLLAPADGSRAPVCENFGVSATDLLEYWHRIHHDVLAIDPPNMIVLCIYPGNDFQGPLPDDAFDGSDKPLEDHYQKPGWVQHAIAWVNLHSKFGCYLLACACSVSAARRPAPADQAPKKLVGRPGRSGSVGRCAGGAAVTVNHQRDRRGMPRETGRTLRSGGGPGRQLCGRERREPARSHHLAAGASRSL